jgi:hypothetical protein
MHFTTPRSEKGRQVYIFFFKPHISIISSFFQASHSPMWEVYNKQEIQAYKHNTNYCVAFQNFG